MEPKQIFIQLNKESQFDAVKITRSLNDAEDRVDRQRKGLLAGLKMDFGKISPDFLNELNTFYQSKEIPLLSNASVLMIHRKWRINRSIFNVLKIIFVQINNLGLTENKEFTEKIIRYIELEPNSHTEREKLKVWLTCQIILKVYAQGNVEKLDQFISAIWSNKNVPYSKLVPSVFKPKLADSHFKTIWKVFSIFKKKQAPPEIYLTFFNDFIIKISDKILAEKDFLTFLEFLFNKNKIEIVRGLSFTDYRLLYELKKINEGLLNKMPDLSKTDIEYNHKDRTSAHRPGIRLVYNLLIEYGVSHFFIYNFFQDNLSLQEKEWFIDVLQGINLADSKNLPFKLTRKIAHFFRVLPSDWKINSNQILFQPPASYYGITNNNYSLTQSLIYCAIYFDVRDEVYTREVLRNLRRTVNVDFWITTLCQLYHKGLREYDLNQVFDYIDDQVIRNGRKINFNTKKLTNLLEEAHTWHDELILMRIGKYKRVYHLPKSDIGTFKIEYKDKKYKIKQLLTNKELVEEGIKLKHCVGTYTDNCIDRGSFIFSLRLDKENEEIIPLITIEVNNKRILQKRGKWNRDCLKEEDSLIQIWATENKLKFM
jgi:hypothetical protein